MFTLDAVRRMPSVETESRDVADITGEGRRADRPADLPADRSTAADDVAAIRQSLAQDLIEADTAIMSGRIEDAHRALIHAQDMVFERHLALGAADSQRPGKRSTDLFLHLTNRLIDANRFKDRAIIAECRALLDLLADTYAAGRTAPEPTLT